MFGTFSGPQRLFSSLFFCWQPAAGRLVSLLLSRLPLRAQQLLPAPLLLPIPSVPTPARRLPLARHRGILSAPLPRLAATRPTTPPAAIPLIRHPLPPTLPLLPPPLPSHPPPPFRPNSKGLLTLKLASQPSWRHWRDGLPNGCLMRLSESPFSRWNPQGTYWV